MPTSRPSRAASALSRSRAASLLRELPSRLPGRLADDAGSARLIGELRTALPALPRALGPRDLVSAIEQILQRAARHELEREGLDLVEALVDLPDGWTRRDLLAAEIPRFQLSKFLPSDRQLVHREL